MLKEWIIHLAASAWIYSNHIAPSVVFLDRFSDIFLVFEIRRFLHGFEEGRVLDRILIHESLDVALHLMARLTRVDVISH